jgi:hypothetical protein
VAQALADKFTAFSKGAADVGGLATTFAAGKAQEAGTAEGLAGKPNFRQGVSSLTAVGRAYNSAAETGYVAQAQTDVHETMNRLELENEADVNGFTAKADGYAKGLLAEAPEEMRPVLQHILTTRTLAGVNKVSGQQMAKERSQAYADYTSSMPAVAANTIASAQTLPADQADAALTLSVADNKARLDELVKSNAITPEHAATLQNAFHAALDKGLVAARTEGAVNELMNLARENVQIGDAALGEIDKRKDLTADDKEAIRTGYEKQRNQLFFERSRQYVQQSGDLASALGHGDSGADVAHTNLALYQHGAISVDEYQSNEATIARNADKHKDDVVDIAAINAALAGGRGLDPTNEKQRKALDKMFVSATAINGIEQGDPRWQASAVQIAHRTNMLPESAESWARVNMVSADPVQAAAGASFFARVKDANPAAWDYEKDPKIAAFAEQLNANLAAGVPTDRAWAMAHGNVYETTEDQKKILAARYETDKVAKNNAGVLQGRLNGDPQFDPSFMRHFGMASAPAPSLEMQGEYNGLVSRMYNYTNGDVTQAQRLAYDAIKSRYGVTTMNGAPEIVKYSPEKFYGLPPQFIRADVADVVKAATGNTVAIPTRGANEDMADLQAAPGSPGTDSSQWNKRQDGTDKGNGWLGLLRRPDGSVSSEISVGMEINGKETELPLLVPTLTKDEVQKVLALPLDEKLFKSLPPAVKSKAIAFAEQRIAEGKSPFASPAESPKYNFETVGNVDPAKVRIHATPDVERTKGQRGWLLQTLDEYGNYDTLRDQQNQPVYYDLPLDPAALKAAAEKASAAADVVSNKARAEAARTDANAEAVRQQDIAGRTEGRP